MVTFRLLKLIQLPVFVFVCFTLVSCGQFMADPPPTPTTSPQILAGMALFSRECSRCHGLAAETVIVGPPLGGIADRARERVPGQDAAGYLLQSILAPDRYLVEGYENLMPSDLGKKLTGEELDAIIAYLLTLHE